MEFLNPPNRKVLAYLRRYEDQQILCVANLSRFAQPVDLELAELAGMTPVEMIGYVQFPTIEKQPYRLTLAPYTAFCGLKFDGQPELADVAGWCAARVAPDCLRWLGVFVRLGARAFGNQTVSGISC